MYILQVYRSCLCLCNDQDCNG